MREQARGWVGLGVVLLAAAVDGMRLMGGQWPNPNGSQANGGAQHIVCLPAAAALPGMLAAKSAKMNSLPPLPLALLPAPCFAPFTAVVAAACILGGRALLSGTAADRPTDDFLLAFGIFNLLSPAKCEKWARSGRKEGKRKEWIE
jgi:hypothetical protein